MKKSIKILLSCAFVLLIQMHSFAQDSGYYNNLFSIQHTFSKYPDWQNTPRSLGLSYQRNIGKHIFVKAETGAFTSVIGYEFYNTFRNRLDLTAWSITLPFYMGKYYGSTVPPNFVIMRAYSYTNIIAGYYTKIKKRHQIGLGAGMCYRRGDDTIYDYTIDFGGGFKESILSSKEISEWGYCAELQYQYRIYKGITVGATGGYKLFKESTNEWNYGISLGYAFGK